MSIAILSVLLGCISLISSGTGIGLGYSLFSIVATATLSFVFFRLRSGAPQPKTRLSTALVLGGFGLSIVGLSLSFF